MIDMTRDASCTTTSYANCEVWSHQDRLGSVVATTDSTGAVIDKYRYSPYGKSGHEGVSGFPFRYTGQRLDAETGLYYYKARYYDPETGRFLQTDPIGYEDQMNLYAYVGNDPVNAIDPSGLRKADLERELTMSSSEIGRATRLNKKTATVTVETDLSDAELATVASELSDTFFEANDGRDFSSFDSGEPGYVDSGGAVRNGAGYENERGRIRIGVQIARGLNTVAEEIDLRSGGYKKPFVYDPWSNGYGRNSPAVFIIERRGVSAGIQQTVMTVYHEQLHLRWGSSRSDHQRVYNKVYDDLTPLGFSGHYRCLDRGVGCR